MTGDLSAQSAPTIGADCASSRPSKVVLTVRPKRCNVLPSTLGVMQEHRLMPEREVGVCFADEARNSCPELLIFFPFFSWHHMVYCYMGKLHPSKVTKVNITLHK